MFVYRFADVFHADEYRVNPPAAALPERELLKSSGGVAEATDGKSAHATRAEQDDEMGEQVAVASQSRAEETE